MAPRRRLDAELVRRGLAPSRARAVDLIEEGLVIVSGAQAAKASRLVHPGEAVVVLGDGPRFVSRGGVKLDAALDHFAVEVSGLRAIDVGSSTGGFTDCMLQRGAREVVAIDVGRNQLHEKLRLDPRVGVHEQTNVRHLTPGDVGGAAELVVADLSFISLRTVAEPLMGLCCESGRLVVLVKPQFEAGRAEADRGRGVIRDPAVWKSTLVGVGRSLSGVGGAIMGVMVSPITGGDGNVEFFVYLQPSAPSGGTSDDAEWDRWCDDAIGEAGHL